MAITSAFSFDAKKIAAEVSAGPGVAKASANTDLPHVGSADGISSRRPTTLG
jgi:hypothetical protein